MAYLRADRYLNLLLLLVLCCPALSAAQTDAEEDDFKLARNLFRDAGDYATASALFAEFIRNYPDSPQLAEARLMLAQAYRQNGRCDLAVSAYETFYLEHADHLSTADARRERAACLSEQGQFLPAARAYEEVQRRFSASEFAARALLDAAANYTQGQDLQQAIAVYGRLLSDYPTAPQVHPARYRLARLRFAAGRAEEAQQLLGQIIATEPAPPEAPSALLFGGRIDLFLGHREAAEVRFKSLERRFASAAQTDSAHLDRADYLYGLRLFSQAGDAYQQAYDKMGDTALKESALLGLADARRQSRETREALTHYEKLIAGLQLGHPAYLKARLGQAIALGQAGQFALAVGMFQGLIQIGDAPEAKDALRELGALYKRRGDHSRSITWYRRYLQETDTASDAVRFDLAELYASTGYYEEAIALCRQLAAGQGAVAAVAQFGLAQVFEQSAQPRAALREYVAYLELFPAGHQSETVRERIEYLREFTIMDLAGLNRALQKAWIDELSGTPRQLAQLDVARVLFAHHDFAAAAKSFEHYAAAYPGDHYSGEAQYFLAESLLKLARQRQLETQPDLADSLRTLALQEYRILASAAASDWGQRARIRLIETEAESGPDSLRWSTLETGFAAFVAEFAKGESAQLDQALLQLGNARLLLGADDATRIDEAAEAYDRLRRLFPDSPLVPRALLGTGLCHGQKGQHQAAADSLERVLRDYPDSPLTARVLFELGHIRLAQKRPQEAIARLQELRWGYPAFPERRAAQKLLGDTYFQLGEYADAIEHYRPLVTGATTTDDRGPILRRIAQAYHRLNRYDEALETYRQVLADEPDAAGLDSIYFAQAVLQLQLGQENEAFRLFQQVGKDFAAGALGREASTRAGHIAFARERYKQAHQIYQPLLEQNEDPLVHGQAILALFRLERLEAGRKAAKRFAKRFKEAAEWGQRFRLEEGQYYLQVGNYKKALTAFREVEEGEWADDAAYQMATALWQQNKATPSEEGAARALEAVARFVQEHPASPHAANAYLRLGDYQYSLHNYLQAAGAYKRVLDAPQVDRDLAQDAMWKLLKSYQGAHEYEAAHQVVNRLLRQYPEHPRIVDAQLEQGIILKEKGQYARAIEQFTELLSQQLLEGNSASEARFYVGESYQNMGEYRKAIEAYYKVSYHGAEGFSQWITSADFQRARCHESLGEHTTAITVYERIVRREGGQSPQGEMAREQIDTLRRRLGNLN
ncbi:MAG: tetratricopeptide repeat protein [Candidatus Latescibacterota bacterium]|nr:tetratricopeptide repeat protein [Candidatus Latescibacterota bacterium]